MMKKECLNIGCGYKKNPSSETENWMNIDKAIEVKPDMVVDLEKGLPFRDDSFDHIYSSHCIEHVRPDKWEFILNEIARVAKQGCHLRLLLPFDNMHHRCNVNHYRTFTWGSFGPIYRNSDRAYYDELSLVPLDKEPNRYYKLFFHLFPFLKNEIEFNFKIVKKRKQGC